MSILRISRPDFGLFFKTHEPTWLPEIGGEPFSCFSSFIIGRTRPLPDGDVVKRGVFHTARGIFSVSIQGALITGHAGV